MRDVRPAQARRPRPCLTLLLAVGLVALWPTQSVYTQPYSLLPTVFATPLRHSSGRSLSIPDHGCFGIAGPEGRTATHNRRRIPRDNGERGYPDADEEAFEMAKAGLHSATTTLHVDISDHGARAVNQSTKGMGAEYVVLRQRFNGGYIVLSYIIAFVGSTCTLELLLRRTSNRGLHNVLLLLAAGVCFGSVSTFSMHFIGNSSLTLHHPQEIERNKPPFSLTYDAGWTILSLVVSCAVTILAFFVMGLEVEYVGDFFRKIGLLRPKRDDESSSDDDAEEDHSMTHPTVVTDFSRKEKKPPAKVGRKTSDNPHTLKVWNKLETVLGRSKVDLENGSAARRSRHFEVVKSKIESEHEEKPTRTNERDIGKRGSVQEEKIPVLIKPSPSDPVASVYDNIPPESTSTGLLQVEPYDPTLRRASMCSARAEISVLGSDYSASQPDSIFNSRSIPSSAFGNPGLSGAISTPETTSSFESREFAQAGGSTGRRSSVPNLAISGSVIRDYAKPPYALTKIQSLPENDFDDSLPKILDLSAETYAGRSSLVQDIGGQVRRGSSQNSRPLNHNGTGEKESSISRNSPTTFQSYDENHARQHRRRRRRSERSRSSKLKRRLGLDVVTVEDVLKIIISGAIAGVGIAGMHYIGQVSINNVGLVRYHMGTIVASVLIACGAVFAGLYIMFIILRPKLKHGWLTKVGVACVLAAAVCAMHYTAMSGQEYALWKGERPGGGFGFNTKRLIIGLVSALAFVACLSIFSFSIFARLRIAAHKKGRRRVVVATMIYDNENRLLVAPDGVLPMCDIASVDGMHRKSSPSRSGSTTTWDSESDVSSVLDVDLTANHPAFIAALRSTWAWRQPGVYPAGPGNALLRNYSTVTAPKGDIRSSSDGISQAGSHSRRLSVLSTAESANYPAALDSMHPLALNVGKFLDRFQAAVGHLAGTVIGHEQSVRRLGVLYDRILTTGHVKLSGSEGSRGTLANGQLIFLVRRVTTAHEKNQLLSRNYLFAEPTAVANVMSHVLAVPVEEFADIIDDQQVFCDYGMTSANKVGRVYAAASILQPTTFDGIQICVERHRRHQLPMRELCKVSPVSSAIRSHVSQSTDRSDHGVTGSIEEIGEALSGLEGQTLFDMIAPRDMLLEEESLLPEDPSTGRLRVAIVDAIIPMLDTMCTSKEMAKLLPRLQVTPYLVPLTPPLPVAFKAGVTQIPEIQSAAQMAWMVYFQAVLPADGDFEDLDWEPWALFRAQNECVARDGREGIQAARNALLQSTTQSLITPARRPSKVQFSPFAVSTSHNAPVVTDAPSILVNHDNRDALQQFESFAFPGPSASQAADSTTLGIRNSSDIEPNQLQYRRSSNLNLDVFTTPSRSTGQLERAENQGTLNADDEHGKNAFNGVGFYHQDWLSRLVREDMLHRSVGATAFV